MSPVVHITATAEKDLAEIVAYIAQQDGAGQAREVLDRLTGRVLSLESMSGRGNVVPEMQALGSVDWRELHESPWRIIYREWGGQVYVAAVLDSRRNLQDLLEEQLLRP